MSLAFFNDALYREKKIAAWVSVGLLVFISAFMWAPSRDGLEGIYALCLFIPMLCLLPWRKPSIAAYGGGFTLLGLLFAGYSALTTFWAPESDPGFFILQFFILASWLCGLGWMAQRGLINVAVIIKMLIAVGAITSVVNLIVFYTQHPFSARIEGWSVTRNPNHIGSVFGVLTLLAYIDWLRSSTVKQGAYYLLCIALIVVSVLASQSRAALGGLALLIPVAAILYCRSTNKWLLQIAALLALIVVAYALGNQVHNLLFERGISLRDMIWAEVFNRTIQGYAIWGIGLEEEGRITLSDGSIFNHAHNAWLDMFYRTGVVGVGLSVIYFAYLLRHSILRPEHYPLLLWLLFGCIYSLVDSRGFFWQIDPKWFCIWLPAGLIGALVSSQLLNPATPVTSELNIKQ
ncbi:MAG: O-antigen ligase family protein [Cellvibrio sp.]|uniref:O-antigen ligase family protein n=1 Tax=Cellvibrio sp. TaxID=1965322 RepID=UPI0031B35B29